MKLSDFDYPLPPELIAQKPVKPRDHSRLLILDRKTGAMEHKHFYDLVDYLQPGDVLVLNNSKVIPARLIGTKADTGGRVEVFLHQKIKGSLWNCLLRGRVREGLEIKFHAKLSCRVIKNNQDGTWQVKFNLSGNETMDVIEKIGQTPLPPYIKRLDRSDNKNYQTVYADEHKAGSVAAPTAGLHFTPALIKKIKAKGVKIEYLTLHVGLGTFAPVKTTEITKHQMHAEWVEIPRQVVSSILRAKKENRRIIPVGTTSMRTLEAVLGNRKKIEAYRGWVNIFIYPGYKFKVADAMITNFHLPKSSLVMLVSALSTQKLIKKAYQEAIKNGYRFYSYGDAMLII